MANEENETTPAPDETTPEGTAPEAAGGDDAAADAASENAASVEAASVEDASDETAPTMGETAAAAGVGLPDGLDASEVEKLLEGALEGYGDILAQVDAAAEESAAAGETLERGSSMPAMGAELIDQNLELLRDVHLQVKVELGRGRMYLKDILRLGQGSVVELERLAGDPLDIYVNDKVIARGEVLVLNESFCIRITEVFNPEDLRQAVS